MHVAVVSAHTDFTRMRLRRNLLAFGHLLSFLQAVLNWNGQTREGDYRLFRQPSRSRSEREERYWTGRTQKQSFPSQAQKARTWNCSA